MPTIKNKKKTTKRRRKDKKREEKPRYNKVKMINLAN